jgi:hypothetical protein
MGIDGGDGELVCIIIPQWSNFSASVTPFLRVYSGHPRLYATHPRGHTQLHIINTYTQ